MKKICCFVILFLVQACSGIHVERPVLTGELISGSEKTLLFKRLKENSENLQSLKALARIEIIYGKRNTSLRYAVLAQQPDRLRIEGLPLNGSYSLSVLYADAGNLILVDHTTRTVTVTKSNSAGLEDLLALPIEPSNLVHYLAGAAFDKSFNNPSDYQVYGNDSGVLHLLSLKNGSYWKILSKEGMPNFSDLKLEEVQLKKEESAEPYLQIKYDSKLAENTPKDIVFVVPDLDVIIKIKYQYYSTNQIIKENALSVVIPGDYAFVRVD